MLQGHFATWVAKCREQGGDAHGCWDKYRQAYDAGKLRDVPQECREHFPQCPSPSTLRRWQQSVQRGEVEKLKDSRGHNRRLSGVVHSNPEIESALRGGIAYLGTKATARNLLKLPQIKALNLSLGAVQRYLTWLKREHRATWLQLSNPKAYRNSAGVKFGSRSRDLLPNLIWELDFSRNDLVLDLEGKRQRFSFGGVIDVATRRCLFILSTAPRGAATVDLLIRALGEWGLPVVVRPDNGREFINQQVRGLAAAVGFDLDPCLPGHPEEKPHIESLFRTVNHDKIPLLPSYVGNNVANRQVIREGKGESAIFDLAMDWATFGEWLDTWRQEYERREHSSLGCSPLEKLAEFEAEGWKRQDVGLSVEQMRVLALPRKPVTVNPKGIKHQRRVYVAPELGELIGEKVWALIDQADPRHLWVLDGEQERILCEAQWEQSMTAEELAVVTAQAQRAAKQIEEQGVAARKEARNTAKALRGDPLQLLDRDVVAERQAKLEAKGSEMAGTLGSAHAGQMLPEGAAVDKVVNLHAFRRKEPEPGLCDPVIGEAALVAAEVLQPADLRSEEERLQVELIRILRQTPAAEWTDADRAYIREHREEELLAAQLAFPGFLAPGVAEAVRELIRESA